MKKATIIRDGKLENLAWLREQALKRTVAEIAYKSGMSVRGAENLRSGKNKIGFDGLIDRLRNDPDFAGEFAAFIGLVLPEQAGIAAALTKLSTAIDTHRRHN